MGRVGARGAPPQDARDLAAPSVDHPVRDLWETILFRNVSQRPQRNSKGASVLRRCLRVPVSAISGRCSGRRGRRFKSGHPDQNRRSERCLSVSRLGLARSGSPLGADLGRAPYSVVPDSGSQWEKGAEFGPGRGLRHRGRHGLRPGPVVPCQWVYRRKDGGGRAARLARAIVVAGS